MADFPSWQQGIRRAWPSLRGTIRADVAIVGGGLTGVTAALLMQEQGMEFRLLLLSDHKTLMSSRTHDGDPVPFMIYDSTKPVDCGLSYTEENGEKGPYVEPGTKLMDLLFEKC